MLLLEFLCFFADAGKLRSALDFLSDPVAYVKANMYFKITNSPSLIITFKCVTRRKQQDVRLRATGV